MLAIVVISIVMGVVPMIIYAGILYWLDRWEKEPIPLLIAAFFWGLVPAIIGALIVELVLEIPVGAVLEYKGLAYDLVSAGLIAPVVEESIKAIAVLLIFVFFYNEFDSVLDGIIYGSLAGFGFAAVENVLYFVSSGSQNPSSLGCLIFMRAFLFGLNHAFFTSLTGIGFAAARFQKNPLLKIVLPLLGLICAIVAHSIHNSMASFGLVGLPVAILADWTGTIGVLIIAVASLVREAGWIKQYLAEEVEQGVLTREQAARTASFTGRIASNFTSLGGGLGKWMATRRFYQQSTELAYKKHQFTRMGGGTSVESAIEKLRSEVARLSPQV
jgi:RsiW-degrading membrane proteinase PrsW (M82 family)